MLFEDEAGFYLLPMAVKAWVPVIQTPQMYVLLTRDHLSSMSAISPYGRLFLQVRSQSYDAHAVVGFLRVLLCKIPGKLLINWDWLPIHRSTLVKALLAREAAKRIHLEQLSDYAPDLNPDEGIWNYLKLRELANVCCRTLRDLEQELMRARERLRHKRSIIRSCFLHCGYV